MSVKDPQIGLRPLRNFHAIVRTGSVTAAARELGVSQPSASRMLAELERMVGFDLFYRDPGRLVPTGDALRLFEEVDLALAQINRTLSLASDIAEFRTGQLKLVAPPSFAEGVLPDIVSSFLSSYPNIRLTIDSRSVETARSLIASRAVDGGFLKLPIDGPDLRPVKVVTSKTVCLMPPGHRLTAHSSLTPRLLHGEPLILLGHGRASRLQIESAFADAGFSPKVSVDTHTIGSAAALAARGVGIALVNELLARTYLRTNDLVVRSFKPKLIQEYAFVTSAVAEPSRVAGEFLRVVQEYFAITQGDQGV